MPSESSPPAIHRLPPEILSTVFLLSAPTIRNVPIQHSICLASVCAYWRDSIIHDPRFWLLVSCSYSNRDWLTNCLETFVARSKCLNFSLVLRAGPNFCNGAVAKIQTLIDHHCGRIESLEFVNTSLGSLSGIDKVFPALRKLLGITHDATTSSGIPYSILSRAVNLEVLQINIPAGFSSWIHTLSNFKGTLRKLDICIVSVASLQHLFQILSPFQVLDTLCLRRRYHFHDEFIAVLEWPSYTMPSTLTSFYVLLPTAVLPLRIPNLRHMGLNFTFADRSQIELAGSQFDFSKIRFLSIGCCQESPVQRSVSGGDTAFPMCTLYHYHETSIFSDLEPMETSPPGREFHTIVYSSGIFRDLLDEYLSRAVSVSDMRIDSHYLCMSEFDGLWQTPSVRHLTIHGTLDPKQVWRTLADNSIYPNLESITYVQTSQSPEEAVPDDYLEQEIHNCILARQESLKTIAIESVFRSCKIRKIDISRS